jgi:hypothetical protein
MSSPRPVWRWQHERRGEREAGRGAHPGWRGGDGLVLLQRGRGLPTDASATDVEIHEIGRDGEVIRRTYAKLNERRA